MTSTIPRLAALLMLATLLAACASEPAPAPATRAASTTTPADFALVITVRPEGFVDPADPLQQPAQYVLEPNRSLRVAIGPGAHHHLFPPVTATLSPQEMTQLYSLIESAELDKLDPREALNLTDAQVTYEISLTANGATHHVVTTGRQTPAVRRVLARLAKLRGV